jgi:DNA-binding transcriptional regulator of glucitol operon
LLTACSAARPRIRDVNRSLLTPRWLLLHLLFVAAIIATGLLAWWQWDRAHEAGGSFQNLGYALQWPLFGVFTVFLWYRLARMELERAEESTPATTTPEPPAEPEPRVRRRPLVPPPATPVTADEDPELAAYNQYLAELNQSEHR